MSAARRAILCLFLSGGLAITAPSSVLGTQSVTLAWNPVINASVAGYKVYYGSVSGNYTSVTSVGNVTNVTVSGLTEGATYYFATTSLSTSGLESGYSSEVPYTVPGSSLPAPFTIITQKVTANITNAITLQCCTNLSARNWWTVATLAGSTTLSFTNMPVVFLRGVCSNLTGSVTLTWPPSTSPGTAGYKVYYGTASGVYSWVVNAGKATTLTISNLNQGQVYYFLVDTYNSLGVTLPYLVEISMRPPITPFALSIGH
jgi:hypothetical protein